MKTRYGKCRLCGKEITKTDLNKQQVIKMEVGHYLGCMWDNMGVYYLCSFGCFNNLKLNDEWDSVED